MTALEGTRGKPLLTKASYREMLAPLPSLPSKDKHNGLGWDSVIAEKEGKYLYEKNGGIAGIATYMEHLPSNVDYAVFFNTSADKEDSDKPDGANAWRKELIEAIRKQEY
ncbi:hypothetical protein KIH39_09015 [Telmatocola sphagniphila]|uniref:Uncharacterized protein n=1 Tax=Telmatocola sphagniphila TaxID=1123043 RepID=A0A8E6EZR6_9BACT|nr:hypothetical protein [Telmatocola sphagniphila]QVL34028.1 hypothetical protein KIH39_09015 [Telmatocola sphagniphila]